METDYAVIGGGLVGMAVAYGLVRLGHDVTVFDEADDALRASRGNFGLVWVQGKGVDMPDYARWTRHSSDLWAGFAEELRAETGVDVEHTRPGGLDICLDEAEAETKTARLEGLRDKLGGKYPFEFLGPNALRKLVPEIGTSIAGALFCPDDGHTNPLYLLRALHAAYAAHDGRLVAGTTVSALTPEDDGFRIDANTAWRAKNVVLCAGLGNAKLAPMVGLSAPVVPNRGQLMVTERVKPFLRHPSVQVRQVGEGAVQIGDSHEDAGFDDRTSTDVLGAIAKRAVRIFPLLEHVRIVRSWAALRVMSPDGHPIYDRSAAHPGAHVVTCHSGVTLAAAHALTLAPWIAGGTEPANLESFSARRF